MGFCQKVLYYPHYGYHYCFGRKDLHQYKPYFMRSHSVSQ